MPEQKTITLEVFRYRPDEGGEPKPTFQRYDVPFREDWVVLDALIWIKDNLDGTLSYRWSCHMKVCGSCGMNVNGQPVLTCSAFLRDYYPNVVRVEPLSHFEIERDLIIEMDSFMSKLKKVKPWTIRTDGDINDVSQGEYRQSPAELARYKQHSMCINCMLCYAACPVVGHDAQFLGPAAIALGHRYNLDSRDQGNAQRSEPLGEEKGVWGCTFVGECSVVCPKNVDPAGAIQQAKITAMVDYFKSFIFPKGAGQ